MSNNNFINEHIDGANTCVICGRDIPEGRQVCVICGEVGTPKREKSKTTDWLVKGIPKEQLEKEKVEAINNNTYKKLLNEYDTFESEDIPMPTDADAPVENVKEPCHLCDNARVNDELEDYNDLSSTCIGRFDNCRVMLTSGGGEPLRMEIQCWNKWKLRWEDAGAYYPKFCPECGREIREY